ncbi:MAG: TM2 domain-containing protein [Marinilabiliaceae bacterium]|nr:TM2 domain-containing protein [Marinilabiliaceae bacterium]
MEQSRVDMFVSSVGERFPSERLMLVRDQLSKLDDSKLPVVQSVDYKNPTTMLIISLFVGAWGVDRFMLGETGLGVAKLLTCGGAGIWTIIDWFTITNKTKEYNYQKFCQVAV